MNLLKFKDKNAKKINVYSREHGNIKIKNKSKLKKNKKKEKIEHFNWKPNEEKSLEDIRI